MGSLLNSGFWQESGLGPRLDETLMKREFRPGRWEPRLELSKLSLELPVEAASDDAGWANISAVDAHISNQSSFDSRNYGYRKLSTLIETTELFDIEKRNPRGNNIFDLYLRDKRFSE